MHPIIKIYLYTKITYLNLQKKFIFSLITALISSNKITKVIYCTSRAGKDPVNNLVYNN
jgi:hypothetical protein